MTLQVGLVVANQTLFAIGGYNGEKCLRSIESYSQRENKWEYCGTLHERGFGAGISKMKGNSKMANME